MELQISVKDDKAELFLQILQEFKSDMVEKFTIMNRKSDIEYVNDQEQKEIEELLSQRSIEDKELSHSKSITIEL